jgi:hypothetical protein
MRVSESHNLLFQEELLGLADQEDAGYLASQIDPDVLFTQSETRQVVQSFFRDMHVWLLDICYQISGLHALKSWHSFVHMQGRSIYTPRLVLFDLSGSLGGKPAGFCSAPRC